MKILTSPLAEIAFSAIQIYVGLSLVGLFPDLTGTSGPPANLLGGLIVASGAYTLVKRAIGKSSAPINEFKMNEADSAEVSALIHAGKEIPAMTFIRQKTGVSLAEAKEFIDQLKMK